MSLSSESHLAKLLGYPDDLGISIPVDFDSHIETYLLGHNYVYCRCLLKDFNHSGGSPIYNAEIIKLGVCEDYGISYGLGHKFISHSNDKTKNFKKLEGVRITYKFRRYIPMIKAAQP